MAAAETIKNRSAIAAVISAIFNTLKQLEKITETPFIYNEVAMEGIDHDTNFNNYNTIYGNASAISAYGIILNRLCSSRGLCAQILLSVASTIKIQVEVPTNPTHPPLSLNTNPSSNPTPTPPPNSGTLPGAPNDPVLEWAHILFLYLLKKDQIRKVYETLKPRGDGVSVWDFDTKSDTLFEEDCKYGNSTSLGNVNRDETSVQSLLTYEQIILLQILLVIFEDSEFTEELNSIDFSDSKNDSEHIIGDNDSNNDEDCNDKNKNSIKNNEYCITKTVTWNILHIIAELISNLCEDHCKHNKSEMGNDNNIDNNGPIVKSTIESFQKDTEVLLLCLNTFGAGVSYPPRDLGSPLR